MKRLKKVLLAVAVMIFCLGVSSLTVLAASTDTGRESASAGSRHVNYLSTSWAAARFAFTPATTGNYTFTSEYIGGTRVGDPYFFISSASYASTVGNALGNVGYQNDTARTYSLAYNDDGGSNCGFQCTYKCYAGTTYYLFASKYRNEQTNYYLNVSGPGYYYMTLDRNGGSGGSSYYYDYGGTAWLYSNSGSATNYITPPTRAGYTFVGYYNTYAESGGEQFIASNGALLSNAKNAVGGTLVARWQQNVFTLTYNNQGVANTTTTVNNGSIIPASVTIPTRTGYSFGGYYTSTNGGGTAYYNSNGQRTSSATMSANLTLYAKWTPMTYAITYEGLENASISNKPASHTFGTTTIVPEPTKTDYTFMGWTVNGGMTLIKNLTLSQSGYTQNITLTANWVKTTDAQVDNSQNLLTSEDISKDDLQSIFNNPVTDTKKGVTAEELNNSASIVLKLVVTNADSLAEDETAIRETTNGEVVKFFDVKIVKEVTSTSGQKTTTTLTEVPQTITIRIPLNGDLSNKSSYQVLRYHVDVDESKGESNAVTSIFAMDDASGGEYSTVVTEEAGNQILEIHTRMFSTYAVAAGETSLNLQPAENHNVASTAQEASIDVQGKISQEDIKAAYKLDISWGPMVFSYMTSRTWDPNNHEYMDASYAWSDASFMNGNNEITVKNHSNADVTLDFTFAKETSQLEGVDVKFKSVNTSEAEEQTQYALAKVQAEGAEAPEIKSYLWMSGTPVKPIADMVSGGESAITKVGVITVTATPDTLSTLTPKNSKNSNNTQ